MNKKILIPLIVLVVILCGGIAWLFFSLQEQKQANQEMQELVELDKQEMENEYARFALQYSEMKTMITNDSIVEQLTHALDADPLFEKASLKLCEVMGGQLDKTRYEFILRYLKANIPLLCRVFIRKRRLMERISIKTPK